MPSLSERVEAVRKRIERAAESAGRTPQDITLVAVTKNVPVDCIREAIELGISQVGENRVQEAEGKIPALGACAATWHLIGSLQTNKINKALRLFSLIHSIDSTNLASAVQSRAEREGIVVPCLIQVNVSGEETKHGITFESAVTDIREIAGHSCLEIRGLMTVAPYTSDPECVRPVFRRLRELADRVRELGIPGTSMDVLSMGMSGDFEVAIEEGATMVRIGSALFGQRG